MARLTLPLALLGALALAGCGVKGPLEPPPGAPQAEAPPPAARPPSGGSAQPPQSAADMANAATPQADWQKPKSRHTGDPLQGAVRPDQPFVLDGLL